MENGNNHATLIGIVEDAPTFGHSHCGESFYNFVLKVKRLSENTDDINITISEKLLKALELLPGDEVEVSGQYRSYNNYSGVGNKLILTLFVQDIKRTDELSDIENPNKIYLNGFICKPPIFRTTPFGREIADIILAVNRAYGKSDYIPCIAWGRNAKFASCLKVGDRIELWGRIQSREYQKKISEEDTVTKVAYEISISKLQAMEQEEPVE